MTPGNRTTHRNLALVVTIWAGIVIVVSGLPVFGNGPFEPHLPPVNLTPFIDLTPPVTNISLMGTQGDNDWWTSDVTVTLTAKDVSGIDKTSYSLFAEGQTMSIIITYTAPFKVTLQGKSRLSYHSVDKIGNVEASKTADIWIDKAPPEGSIVIQGNAQYTSSRTVSLALSASDARSGVAMMRFNTDNGTWSAWDAFSATKSWEITGNDGSRSVYVQFKDKAGLVSQGYHDSIILDTLPPTVSFAVSNGTKTKSSTFTANWTGEDPGSGVDHYEARVDGGAWINTGSSPTSTFSELGDGKHTVEVKAVDRVGRSEVYALRLTVNRSPLGGPGYLEEVLLIIVIAAVAVGAVLYWLSKRPKKPPTPSRLNVKVEPAEIIADGKSSSTITVELLDKKGKPADAQSEVQITLSATSGRLPSPIVRVPRGRNSGTAVLLSSTEFGTLSISAEATGLEGGTARMTFKEKPRFCMGCGTRMSVKDTVCQKCGASPSHFGGLETKTCHCGTVLPFTASFCSECGAKQQPAKAAGPGAA